MTTMQATVDGALFRNERAATKDPREGNPLLDAMQDVAPADGRAGDALPDAGDRAADAAPEAPAEERAAARTAPGVDWWIFVLAVMLLGIGLVMVLSASGVRAEADYGDKYYYFKRQLAYAGGGLACMAVAALIPRRVLHGSHYFLLAGTFVLLVLTLTPLSPSINGAHRWIRIAGFSLQPMEFAKIALALYLAYYMSEKQNMVKSFTRGVVPPVAVTLIFCGVLLRQPDFGSAVLLVALLLVMFLVGGTRFIYLGLAGIGAGVAAWALAVFEPYRMARIMTFLHPFEDMQNAGYQGAQSLMAIGSGSFFGAGIGAGTAKLFFLPEPHNDFIMAVLAEETGFVGVSVVLLLFFLFFWRCYLVIQGQESLRDRLTAVGVTLVMCMGVVLNIAVVMSLAPAKGVALPFMSYGGSNLLATLICVGLMLNLSRTARPRT